MGTPEPIEPEDDDKPGDSGARADWIVGAEEGISAEIDRKALEKDAGRPLPRLMRPGGDEGEAPFGPRKPGPVTPLERPEGLTATGVPSGITPSKTFGRVSPDLSGGDFEAGLPWTPPTSSVPTLRREAPRRPEPAESTREFPVDDVDEPRETADFAIEPDELIAAAPAAGPAPHAVVPPSAFDVQAPSLPFWTQIPHLLQTNRAVQGVLALVLVLFLAYAFWPRTSRGVSVSRIRQNAATLDGTSVTVSGRIGEVFEVGGGYAFNLHQGRDTIVVFTRSRVPHPRDKTVVTGRVSTGYLDGQPRAAIFEDQASK